ncbi:MAG: HAMP domain-containing histidine kinase [Sandaracinaceae bacterium]|nr:HAMP domain-containing histidine kinase [Sandaracinaceae bacterium]
MSLAATLALRLVPTVDDSFRASARLAVLERVVRVRALVAPLIAAFALAFILLDPTLWRRATLAAVVLVLVTVSYVEWSRARRLGSAALNLRFNFFVMAGGQAALVTTTGALMSPLGPVLIVMAMLAGLLFDRATVRAFVLLLLPTFFALAFLHVSQGLVPELFGEARAFERGVAPWLLACTYSSMVIVASRIGAMLQGILERLFFEAVAERDRRLAGYAEQTAALSGLSAEIAHELKNPLASVKGLGALVAKDVSGKAAERVAVLRREVDRMQGVLEELLDFSRPLVPLAMEEVDALALCRDVARLHEGSAADRAVTLLVRGDAVTLACDPRKVRQVLVNLVQNALHASPRGGEVELSVAGEGDALVVRVDDRGPGLADELGGRAFEAGVTTKRDGSGIGLAVARSLARQHGGELTLGPREGGGCRATLTLPRRPRAEEAP